LVDFDEEALMAQAAAGKRCSLSVAVLAAGFGLWVWTTIPAAAHASEDVSGIIALAAVGIGVPVAAFETVGTIGAVKAGIAASNGYRTSTGWLTMGYITGIVNIGFGAFFFRGSGFFAESNLALRVGTGTLAVVWGAANLGLSIWGSTKPARSQPVEPSAGRPTVSIAPLLGKDARGGLVAGLAATVLHF
jgi:hypothetical protein